MAPTAWPTIAAAATPPGPTSAQYVTLGMPTTSIRSTWRTVSMSQRTMPSMSAGVSPASAIAASAACVASVRSLRPELRL